MKNLLLEKAQNDYNPNWVKINESAIIQLPLSFTSNQRESYKETLSSYEMEVLSNLDLETAIHFLLGLNSINYKYWDKTPQFVRYTHNNQVGALAAFAGFTELFFHTANPNELTEEKMLFYFGNIPDMTSRLEILKESLDINHLTKATHLILHALENNQVDVQLAHEIAKIMPLSFDDPYLKKIQLALYEMALLANDKHNYQVSYDLTVAADYQLPKVLEALGVLEYSEALTHNIANEILIPMNSEAERAIRSATILSCELIIKTFNLPMSFVDRWLWLQRNDFPNKKFHLTNTTYY